MNKIKINKLEAAHCQILTAIRMYFNYDDLVSMHTLAANSFKITQNICDSKNSLPDSFTDWVEQIVKTPAKKKFWTKFHETTNFIKHAEKDPNGVHEFSLEETEHVLFLAVHQYHQLTNDWSAELRLFSTWYMIQHPDTFNTSVEIQLLGSELFGKERNVFWSELLPMLQENVEHSIFSKT